MCLSSTCSGSTWLVTVTVVTASLSELGRARWPSTMFVLENARYCKNTTYLSSSVVWLQQEGQARAADSCMFICLSPHSSFCLLYRFIHSFIPSIQPMVFPSLHPLLIFCNHPSIHPSIHVSMYPSIPLHIIFALSTSFISTIYLSIRSPIQDIHPSNFHTPHLQAFIPALYP